uniref:Uncharacterized protein n=1 Tax=Micrurus spixii TaxID=129469 RepID=A0A2D4M0N8_9SAUR
MGKNDWEKMVPKATQPHPGNSEGLARGVSANENRAREGHTCLPELHFGWQRVAGGHHTRKRSSGACFHRQSAQATIGAPLTLNDVMLATPPPPPEVKYN